MPRSSTPSPESTAMFREAAQAPAVVARQYQHNAAAVAALADELRRRPPRFVVTCARGSSDHAATYAKYLIETQLGRVTASLSPSVASLYGATPQIQDALYLTISQSGRSPDLLRNAEAARAAGARVVAMVNAEDSPLAQLAHVVLPLHAGPEHSVAATKSCLASFAAVLHLVAHWRDAPALYAAAETLPDTLQAAWGADWSAMGAGLDACRNLFIVGRGVGLAAAQEAALKLKETSGMHAEAYSAAEVRHGPMALVGLGFPVLCLAQPDEALDGTLALAADFRARGARVWIAGPGAELPLVPAPHAACAPLLLLQSLYRLINALSLRRGFDPDKPPHLRKVTETV